MTFLNWAMLAGLAAVAIPILIHLLNRQRATLVDWGAMRFLLESLTSRSRRILIEEIILMALRCLAVALLVLAMARPFLPSRTTIPWALVVPAILASAMCAGIAAAVWSSVRARWLLLGVAVLLAGVAVSASVAEYWLQGKEWSLAGGERDVAVVVDGSASMTIPLAGQTNFQRAIDEARAVVEACHPADAVSVLVAGPVPRPIVPGPVADRKELEAAFKRLMPTGGSMRVLDALVAAGASLREGHNPAKKIVLITDGQSVGWDARSEARWQFLAAGLRESPIPPQVICRTLALPKALRNAAIGDVRFSRLVVGTDRPVRIDAAILNTGTTVLEPLSIELSVDGVPAARQEAAEMVPGAAETVRFDHQFDKPGPHIVMAKVLSEDEMPSDNSAVRVLDVVDKLPVLVVEGDPSPRPLDGAASFIEIALTPADEEPDAKSQPKPKDAAGPEDKLGRLVAMRTVAAPEIQSIPDLRPFKVIVLANVPKLPQATAAALRAFVQEGGGLLIVAGDKMIPDFYNRWMVDGGEPFAPAALAKRRSLGEKAARLGLKTFRHPALELLADTSQSDADRAGITSFWALDVDQRDQNVRTAALLDTGEPFLVERKVGKGVVLQTAVALDRKESNLPSLKCFVPLVHELTYYLAAPGLAHPNVRPGSEFVLALPFKNAAVAKKASEKKQSPLAGELIEVITPSEQRLTAAVAGTPAGCRVTFAGTYEPGLYHLILPARTGDTYVVPPLAKRGLPFVVLNDAEESRLTALTDAEFEAAAKPLKEKDIDLFRAQTTSEMTAAVSGNVPGEEMWKYLAVALLGALLAEIGLTRWIAVQRRMHLVETVTFGPATVDVQTFRERARGLLAIPSQEPESVSKT